MEIAGRLAAREALSPRARSLPQRNFENPSRRLRRLRSQQRAFDKYQRPSIVPKRRAKRMSPLPFFGSVARTEILLLLSANGPLHVREIARLRGADSAGTFRSIERLQAAGIVAKRDHGRRIVALDRSDRAFPRLQTFLLELAREFPPSRIDVQSYRHGLPLPFQVAKCPPSLSPLNAR